MKKLTALGLTLVFLVFGLAACKKSGASKVNDMLSLIPKDAQGIVVIDVSRAMTIGLVDKAIKENSGYQKYQEFIKEIGIDPQKDIYYAVLGISGLGQLAKNAGAGVAIINLKYVKDAVLAKIKKEEPRLAEETYEGTSILIAKEKAKTEEKGEQGEKEEKAEQAEKMKQPAICIAFLDESDIAAGTEKEVKAVIDISKKKADNVFKNAELAALIDKANKRAMAWIVMSFPPEMMKQVVAENPLLSSLENLKALSIYYDYKNKSFQAEIKGIGGDATKNKQLADTLTGFKGMGGLAAGGKPEIGELLNKIEISSTPDYVKIYADLPEDLMSKITATAEKQVEEKVAQIKGEEKKEEKK